MPRHEEGIELENWVKGHEPGDELGWKSAFWNQILFVRDQLPKLFFTTYEDYKKNPTMVVGTHTSKSIVLPVYSIKIPGLEVRMRDNFYDWNVSIRADWPVLDNFHGLIKKGKSPYRGNFEGFMDDWIFGSYNRNPREFSVELENSYEVYAFLLIVTSCFP